MRDSQQYRNLHAHLVALHNVPAASVVHSALMAFERKEADWSTAAVSWAYWIASDYGSSTGRPIIWLLILTLLSTGMLFCTDGVVISSFGNEDQNWVAVLGGADVCARIGRSAAYTLQTVFNPLGIFNSKPLLGAKTPGIAAASSILGILATICLALFFLAVRRRFKLS